MAVLYDIIKKYRYFLLILIFILILFWKVLLNPSYIIYSKDSDTIEIMTVWNYISHEGFHKYGELPLWNHYTFSGKPFIGFYALSFFNLAHLPFLFFAVDALFLFGYLFIFYYFLAAIFMYIFLRLIKLDEFSSFIGAMVYALSGRLVGYVYLGHSPIYATAVAVPLALIFFELLLQKQKFIYAIFVAAVLAFEFNGSHPQYFFFTFFFLFIYLLYNFIILIKQKQNNKVFKLALAYLLIVIFTITFSASGLLPFLETTTYSTRSNIGYDYASNSSLPLWHLITLFFPNFFGSVLNDTYWGHYHYFGLYIYIGVLPFVLVLFSLFKRNRYANFFLGFAVFSLLYGFGKYFFVHPIFYKFVPGFNLFRAPERMLFFFNFSMAVLSSFGANYLLKRDIQSSKRIVKALAFVLIISVLGTIIFYSLKPAIMPFGKRLLITKYTSSEVIDTLKPLDYYITKLTEVYNVLLTNFIIFSVLLVMVILLFTLFIRKKITGRHLKFGIALIVIIDLFYFGLPYINVRNPNEVFAKNDIVTFLEHDKAYYRVADLTVEKALPQHIAVRYGIQKILGFDSIILKRYNEYIATIGGLKPGPSSTIPLKIILYPKMLDLLNVKYIITNKNLSNKDYDLVSSNDYNIYLNKNSLPRSFIVHKAVIKKESEVLEELKSKNFNPQEYVVLEEPFKDTLGEGNFKEASIAYYSPNKIGVKTSLESPAFLILSEVWYPGWKAYDNGKEIKVYKADYVLRAVYLDKGNHNVDFVFDPQSLKIGILITISSLLVAVILSIVFWRYKI